MERTTPTYSGAEHLPELAMSRPAEARRKAEDVLARGAAAADQTYALQALAIIERESGRIAPAISAIRRGVALSRKNGMREREADLEASLGTILSLAGRRAAAMGAFDRALASSAGLERARVLVRRSAALFHFREFEGASRDGLAAAEILVGHDPRWEAGARSNHANALVGLGRFAEAERQLERAQELVEAERQEYVAAIVLHNRGDCAHRLGDLPRALRLLYEARRRYEGTGVVPPELVRDLAVVQLAAGLTEDASRTADEMVARLEYARDSALRRADAFIAAAIVHLAAGNAERAVDLARRAARSSRRQGDTGAERHARIVLLRAQAATGDVQPRHARAAAALAAEVADRFSAERLDALVLAGRMAQASGLPRLAEKNLAAAAAYRHRGSALRRATAWYAFALLADARGDRRAMLRACARGLDVLDAHALSLGATELRARATVHGSDLAVLATRRVAVDGSARELLSWTERWRASLHSLPWPDVRDDPVLAAELGRLRAVENVLGTVADGGAVDGGTRREGERRRVEERIRRHVHGRDGASDRGRSRLDAAALLDALGTERALVSVVGVRGGRFHVVVARRGRLTHLEAGSVDTVREEIEYARFALRGAAVSGAAVAEALLRAAEPGLARLQATMLGPAADVLGDGPIVLVPPATLQAVPWGALPALRDRDVTVAPSASAWLRARSETPPSRRRVTLIAGADLVSSGAEVSALASAYPDATVLSGAAATAEAAIAALDGAWLAHVGAHGRYRGDNPMFSALELADGPLTVFDLERMQSPPYRLLLTACESGVGSPTGADELLGLTTSLSALGTAGLLAAVVPVSDGGSVGFSLVVHERLRAGDDLSAALLAARRKASSPVDVATAWAFLALGAA